MSRSGPRPGATVRSVEHRPVETGTARSSIAAAGRPRMGDVPEPDGTSGGGVEERRLGAGRVAGGYVQRCRRTSAVADESVAPVSTASSAPTESAPVVATRNGADAGGHPDHADRYRRPRQRGFRGHHQRQQRDVRVRAPALVRQRPVRGDVRPCQSAPGLHREVRRRQGAG
jgi:hypothetical protein